MQLDNLSSMNLEGLRVRQVGDLDVAGLGAHRAGPPGETTLAPTPLDAGASASACGGYLLVTSGTSKYSIPSTRRSFRRIFATSVRVPTSSSTSSVCPRCSHDRGVLAFANVLCGRGVVKVGVYPHQPGPSFVA